MSRVVLLGLSRALGEAAEIRYEAQGSRRYSNPTHVNWIYQSQISRKRTPG